MNASPVQPSQMMRDRDVDDHVGSNDRLADIIPVLKITDKDRGALLGECCAFLRAANGCNHFMTVTQQACDDSLSEESTCAEHTDFHRDTLRYEGERFTSEGKSNHGCR